MQFAFHPEYTVLKSFFEVELVNVQWDLLKYQDRFSSTYRNLLMSSVTVKTSNMKTKFTVTINKRFMKNYALVNAEKSVDHVILINLIVYGVSNYGLYSDFLEKANKVFIRVKLNCYYLIRNVRL